MKTFWKALGVAALAALVPVRFKKDEESGTKTFQSLLWKLDVGPTGDGETTEIGLDLMEGVLTSPLMKAVAAKKEAELFTDDPDEAVLFADEIQDAADIAQEAAEEVQDAAGEVHAAAEEAQAIAEEIQAEAEEANESDFDPET